MLHELSFEYKRYGRNVYGEKSEEHAAKSSNSCSFAAVCSSSSKLLILEDLHIYIHWS